MRDKGGGSWRRIRIKSSRSGCFPFHFQIHPMGGIGHVTGQAAGQGLLVDEGPKTHALDDSLDSDFIAGFGFLVQIRNGCRI